MTYEIVSVACGGPGLSIPCCDPDNPPIIYDNTSNFQTPCKVYQELLDASESEAILYVHDDVTIHDPEWLSRVLALFDKTSCIAVGLGGAIALGNKDLYRKPYNIWNMARSGYASNQTDAEVHGERFTGTRRVAVLDAFFMAVRTDWLRSIGGWPVDHLSHHCLDLWLACMAARHKKEIWLTGVSVSHWGGGTSTKDVYREAKWLKGGSLETDHQEPHVFLYNEFRDVLPLRV